jgi:hypothetical protein
MDFGIQAAAEFCNGSSGKSAKHNITAVMPGAIKYRLSGAEKTPAGNSELCAGRRYAGAILVAGRAV